ncbi:MAG: methionyl-tRNA formyltransferase [Victivallaceae bacterium]|nr:methionyl-tRNA formyltransferase [Victivallaceae bacterium]
MDKTPKIYFLGSGKLAIPFLKRLKESEKLDFIGGATGISRPGKRGKLPVPTAAKSYAQTIGVELEEISDVNDDAFLDRIEALKPDAILVVSFGQILRRRILTLPRFGCVNVHPSLLPRFRGASPVVQTVLAGDAETGVCFMEVAPALDEGGIYRCFRRKLNGNEYADELEAELGALAAGNLDDTMTAILSGKLPCVPQQGAVTFCGKIAKTDGAIDWRADAATVAAKVRAYHLWPGAFAVTENDRKRVTVARARIRTDHSGAPGEIVAAARKDELIIGCGRDALEIEEIVPAGGKPMSGAAFRNGRRGDVRFSPETLVSGSE